MFKNNIKFRNIHKYALIPSKIPKTSTLQCLINGGVQNFITEIIFPNQYLTFVKNGVSYITSSKIITVSVLFNFTRV